MRPAGLKVVETEPDFSTSLGKWGRYYAGARRSSHPTAGPTCFKVSGPVCEPLPF